LLLVLVYHERTATVAQDIGRLDVTTEAGKSRKKDLEGRVAAGKEKKKGSAI
jgi:hypothetical protein